jgi:ribosomal peptide maturation radical SAM protein 1
MGFRAKSPQRVIDELLYLRERYGVPRIDSVDNILDLRYATQVFPELKRRGSDIEMFYEVKANLKYQHLAAMYGGGVRYIQPGIESFSDQVLDLMRKGVSGFQNIQLLRWSQEIGILPAWNILAGFPGESPSEYEWTASIMPLMTHLEPPAGCAPIRLDRFSPFFVRAEEFGLRRVRPAHAYYYVFPLGRRELSRLAYFFEFDYPGGVVPEKYLESTNREYLNWRNARYSENRPRLDANIHENGGVVIEDTRACAVSPRHALSGCDAEVYLACDSVQTLAGVLRRFRNCWSASEVQQALAQLIEAKLIIARDEHYLALGVLRNRPADFFESEDRLPAYVPMAANSESLLRVL